MNQLQENSVKRLCVRPMDILQCLWLHINPEWLNVEHSLMELMSALSWKRHRFLRLSCLDI